MVPSEEIIEIKKKLEEHEKRIENLEKLFKRRGKKVITKRKSIFDHLTYLKSKGFFDQPRIVKEIVTKLAQEGYHYPSSSLTEPLQRATRQKVLGRIKKSGKWAYCKR